MNGVRHGLSGRTFFLLPDEDPEEFQEHEAVWLAAWRPRDLAEHDAAEVAIRALWREIRADRLEAQILTDLFGADRIEDEAERQAAKAAAMKALGTLLRYRAQIAREYGAAMRELDALRQRRLARRLRPSDEANPSRAASRPSQPTPAPAAASARARRTRAPAQPPPAAGAGGHGAQGACGTLP